MAEGVVLELVRSALITGLLVSAPVLAAGLIVGLVISIALAATQIQEFTLTFLPKLLAMAAAGVLCAPWMLRTMLDFTVWVFRHLPAVGQ